MFLVINHALATTDTLRLTYDIGKTSLTPDHIGQLAEAFEALTNADSIVATIIGSADYLGSVDLNRQISDRRVAGVVTHLSSRYSEKKIGFITNSKGEINSHLEEKLGAVGVTADRSVLLIFDIFSSTEEHSELSVDEIEQVLVGQSLVLKDLNFHPGRHVLLPESVPYLKHVLSVLKEQEDITFEIQGHICCISRSSGVKDGRDMDTGKDELSVNRATNIYNYLLKNGIDSTRMTHKGYGNSRPLIELEVTDEDRMKNRRVAIKVTGRY